VSALVLLGEAACAAIAWNTEPSVATSGLLGLTAALLPYMVLVCLAAQASADAASFAALSSARADVFAVERVLAGGVWFVAPYFGPDKLAQAYLIAAAISRFWRVAICHPTADARAAGVSLRF